MTSLTKIFAPTSNRRLNELVGFLLCVSALLLFLALASYSPLDPSFNSASILTGSHGARNWIGILGAYLSDIILQFWGVGSFLLPVFMAMLGARWFRSRAVQSPIAKILGGVWLLMFVPALLAILPGHFRWMGAIPIEGLAGRIVGDVLIRYLNVAGAYIVCTTVLAVALYLTTAFSFSAIEVWAPTRFAFVVALRERLERLAGGARTHAAAERNWRSGGRRNRWSRRSWCRRGRRSARTEAVHEEVSDRAQNIGQEISPCPRRDGGHAAGIERMAEEDRAAFAPADGGSTTRNAVASGFVPARSNAPASAD